MSEGTVEDTTQETGTRAERLGDTGPEEHGEADLRDAGTDGEAVPADRPGRSDGDGAGRAATLIDPERARGYQDRWIALKGDFVDEPRHAVRSANELVGEVLDEVEALFRRQREHLEREMDGEDTSTEDLRLALGRYGSFFDRLLSL